MWHAVMGFEIRKATWSDVKSLSIHRILFVLLFDMNFKYYKNLYRRYRTDVFAAHNSEVKSNILSVKKKIVP
jgi:hypothetical protein